jgi:hypothetical protein
MSARNFDRCRGVRRAAAVTAAAVGASAALADWTVVFLHPEGATSSSAEAVDGNVQVGTARFGNEFRAYLWRGSAASGVELHQPGALYSYGNGAGGGLQAGSVFQHAALWSGTAASWVDLHPPEAYNSFARGTDGVEQVGMAMVPLDSAPHHAALWRGSAESFVDLTPAVSLGAEAYGVHGGQQVGFVIVDFGLSQRATLWTGSAESALDLNPAGAESSAAYGVYAGRQVGSAVFAGVSHAGLWDGSAASWVDLHPTGASASYGSAAHSGGKRDTWIRRAPPTPACGGAPRSRGSICRSSYRWARSTSRTPRACGPTVRSPTCADAGATI